MSQGIHVLVCKSKCLCCPCMGDSQSSPQTGHNYLCREIAALYKDCHTTKLFSRARFCQMFTRKGPARYEVVGKFCTLSRGGGRKSKEHLAPSSVAWEAGQACTPLTTPPTSSLLPSLGGELINLDRRRRLTKHLITFSMRGGIVVIILSASRLASTGSETWKQSSQII